MHDVLCCPTIHRKQTESLDVWKNMKSWNAVDAYELKNASLCRQYNVYGKLFLTTPNEIVISVTPKVTNVDN